LLATTKAERRDACKGGRKTRSFFPRSKSYNTSGKGSLVDGRTYLGFKSLDTTKNCRRGETGHSGSATVTKNTGRNHGRGGYTCL